MVGWDFWTINSSYLKSIISGRALPFPRFHVKLQGCTMQVKWKHQTWFYGWVSIWRHIFGLQKSPKGETMYGIFSHFFNEHPGWKHIVFDPLYALQLLDGNISAIRPRWMNTYDIEGYCVAILNWWFGARWFGFWDPLVKRIITKRGNSNPKRPGPQTANVQLVEAINKQIPPLKINMET